ncbi:MAG: acyl-CoA dehydrogenase family protein [Actinobacteria bacterium]|nr:acyl-CoA dehydrogenase family protein [Actinomycetota bacterium]
MDFHYPPEAEAFRAEFRSWLDQHLTDRYRDWSGFHEDPERLATMREWNALLADAGYAAIAWPEEYGGRGASLLEQLVWAEEMHRAQAPPTLNPIGLANIAPTIMHYGSEEQKRHYLPKMLRGDHIWCQGFSEPDAGSDLAALSATAVRAQSASGDAYVVNGQKVWNTFGNLATHCELLVRTDPAAPKHRGISCLIVEMDSPGVEVRPLVTITGEREFNEIFFTDVRVPAENLLGPENDGWRVAMTTLAHERAGVANLHLSVRKKVADLIATARETMIGNGRAATDDPVLRQRLAKVHLEAELLKLLSWRAVSGMLHGREQGPESSVAKLVWSDLEQEIAEVAGEVLGADANQGSWGYQRVYARSYPLVGGTTQINKNVIAQRILGLPRR